MVFVFASLFFLLLILIPDISWAWGPATHLEIGRAVLHQSELITATGIRDLILRFPQDFLYGNISADIVVGKNLVEELKHCHHWNVAFRVLKRARSDSQRAFAYGYLSHLAADTIAHNNFIPEMMIRSFSARTTRHIYWELRFDALADKRVWRIPKKLVREVHRDNDSLLQSVLEDTPLSFRTNKTLFSSLLILNRVEHWHRMLDLLSLSSRWSLDRVVKDKYFTSSFEAVVDFLNHGHKARCTRKDPTGKLSLNAAKTVRKKLKTSRRQGNNWQESMEKALKWVSL